MSSNIDVFGCKRNFFSSLVFSLFFFLNFKMLSANICTKI